MSETLRLLMLVPMTQKSIATTAILTAGATRIDAHVGTLAGVAADLADGAPDVQCVAGNAALGLSAAALNVGVAGERVGHTLGVLLAKVAALLADSALDLAAVAEATELHLSVHTLAIVGDHQGSNEEDQRGAREMHKREQLMRLYNLWNSFFDYIPSAHP